MCPKRRNGSQSATQRHPKGTRMGKAGQRLGKALFIDYGWWGHGYLSILTANNLHLFPKVKLGESFLLCTSTEDWRGHGQDGAVHPERITGVELCHGVDHRRQADPLEGRSIHQTSSLGYLAKEKSTNEGPDLFQGYSANLLWFWPALRPGLPSKFF